MELNEQQQARAEDLLSGRANLLGMVPEQSNMQVQSAISTRITNSVICTRPQKRTILELMLDDNRFELSGLGVNVEI